MKWGEAKPVVILRGSQMPRTPERGRVRPAMGSPSPEEQMQREEWRRPRTRTSEGDGIEMAPGLNSELLDARDLIYTAFSLARGSELCS